MFCDLVVMYDNKTLNKTFTYKVPPKLRGIIKKGMKVKIPFGKNNILGFVINIKDEFKADFEVKDVIEVIDENLYFNDELMEVTKYLKEITLCNYITSIQTMFPSSLKVKDNDKNYQLYDNYIVLNKEASEINRFIINNGRSKKKIEILNRLLKEKRINKKDIDRFIINELIKLDLVKIEKEQVYRINREGHNDFKVLNDEQLDVYTKVVDSINNYNTYLLYGVTGSGKTEVYINLVKKVLSMNKTALILVPEIGLTTQIVNRFYNAFGNIVAVYHSRLSDGEKYDEYIKIRKGDASIVIGTRSAIFTPLSNIGLIIIDEEHSENYKQENNPKYNALDIAIFRAKYNNIPLILGSATPSLESMARAKKDVYKLLTLKKRANNANLPKIYMVDMVDEVKKRNMIFSDILKNKIQEKLDKNEQVILLLNRRGYSTTVSCSNCGYTYKCPNCDITLTYHKTSNNLRCHFCGYSTFKSDNCPQCKSDGLNYLGLGTEKLMIEILRTFKGVKCVRMDADTTTKKGSHEKIIEDFKNGKYNLLLGTQMISKGLDFPRVSLVGIINADASLNIPDFRSSERTYELLSQTSGRSGRKDILGEVVIQTYNPDNYTLKCVCKNDYDSFYESEMNIRKILKYPPYYFITVIKIASIDYEKAKKEVFKVYNYLKKNIDPSSIILGPSTASMFRLKNVFRFQVLIKYKKDERLRDALIYLDDMYSYNRLVNIEIDRNPLRF